MTQIKSRAETCYSCDNFKFCLVHWGPECKRQGGVKIPRIKSMPVARKHPLPVVKKQKVEKKVNLKPGVKRIEPIITKIANWY